MGEGDYVWQRTSEGVSSPMTHLLFDFPKELDKDESTICQKKCVEVLHTESRR